MNSFIGWIGGKKLLRKEIIANFPTEKIDRYVEVFGGAGWVLFGKEPVSGQLEVFNDINNNLINLYRVIKYHCGELQRELEGIIHSREMFYDFREQIKCSGMTDIQRAAKYYYLIKISFSNDVRSFATGCPGRLKISDNLIMNLEKIQTRLKKVVIENLDFEQLIRVYDRPNSFFYLDPPYMDCHGCYNSNDFDEQEHLRLFQALQNIKGKFVLSYNNTPFIKDLYKEYSIIETKRQNSLSTKGGEYHELIIKNY